ncbi:MAG: hypothetical protein ACYC27_03510 [Armatimonadota bacterium]
MEKKRYYSIRTGSHEKTRIDLPLLRKLFLEIYRDLSERGYFNEAFGFHCMEHMYDNRGSVGSDIASFFFLELRKNELYPIAEYYDNYSEDDIFDVIELLYDLVSDPNGTLKHQWCDCGGCPQRYDKKEGQIYFRDKINHHLQDYGDGWVLNEDGQITEAIEIGMENLLDEPLLTYDPINIDDRMKLAITKFRNRHSNIEDKHEAIRHLSGILEFLRKDIKNVLMNKDEDDLFNIANNFGIRHLNHIQKTEYDKEIWYPWIFYTFLSTIHVVIKLIKRNESQTN